MTCGARILDLDYETTERQDEWMILDTIAASAKERVAAAKEALPLTEQIARARELDSNTGFPFEQALAKKRMSFICEVKKASPSKGLIAPEFPYVQIAKEYETAGADAISVLTEPAYFQGKNEYLTKIRQTVQIPHALIIIFARSILRRFLPIYEIIIERNLERFQSVYGHSAVKCAPAEKPITA